MLSRANAIATIAVRDLGAAADFYERVLGLTRIHEEGGGAYVYRTGSATLLVYVSTHAGTNQATAVTWGVGSSIASIVAELRAKGVRFEHYDMPDTTLAGDVHVSGRMRVAWFKDPDGNIHALVDDSGS